MEDINTIIWDWNGTLLNDTELCITAINQLLATRDLPLLTHERYLGVFGFPVIDYYQAIGFDFEVEPFEIPANQFIGHYAQGIGQCALHAGANTVLAQFKSRGYRQVILSAMEQDKLEASVKQLGIAAYFETISGLNHDYATSKVDNGLEMMREMGFDGKNTCLIGDTLHDLEVANELGCKAILIANGHQSKNRLLTTNNLVLDSIVDLLKI